MSITNLVCKLGLLVHVKHGLHVPKLFAIRALSGRIHVAKVWNVPAKGDVFQRRVYIIRVYDETLSRMPIAR